jgi:hypothetical protein
MDLASVLAFINHDPILNKGYLVMSHPYVALVDTSNTVVLTAPDSHVLYPFYIAVHNRQAASITLQVGTGSTLTQQLPILGPFLPDYWSEQAFMPMMCQGDVYVTASAAGAVGSAADVQVAIWAIAV